MIGVKIEKLCKKDYKNEDSWLLSHIKFCRKGDIVRINDVKDKYYKCLTDPIWSDAHKEWDMKFIMWELY